MRRHSLRARMWLMAAVVSALAAACDNGNGGSSPPATSTAALTVTAPAVTGTPVPPASATVPPGTPTPVPSGTPTLVLPGTPSATPTPAAGGVSALLVLNQAVNASASDALGAPPREWQESPDSASFDRALAAANWSVDNGAIQGVTGTDGRFATGPLSPGPHTLRIAKTLNGNLASFSVPFTAGDDGSGEVVVEVSWGQVKSISTFVRDGVQGRDIYGPTGNWVSLRDDRIGSFGNGVQTYSDPDGDGFFDVDLCLPGPVSCENKDPNCTDAASCPCTPVCPTCTHEPYPCSGDNSCSQAGDQCVCASSCAGCDDCPQRVCVSGCAAVQIMGLDLNGASVQLTAGQQHWLGASFRLSNGDRFDVTAIAYWRSSNQAAARVDSWGLVTAVAAGLTEITAGVGPFSSTALSLSVLERPSLRRIFVENVSCFYPLGAPTVEAGTTAPIAGGGRTDILPVPPCSQVVQIGGTLQFRALGEFDNGYYQDITGEVDWQLLPPEIGQVVAGLFTAVHEGTAALTARLENIVSDATNIRVVSQPTVVAVSIYADNGGVPVVAQGEAPSPVASGMPCYTVGPAATLANTACCCPGPLAGDSAAPCRCNYTLTVLRGDQLHFHATAQYDTGVWQDVTKLATWRSSANAVASIDAAGVMTAITSGEASIDAMFEGVVSDPAGIHVVDQATLQSLFIYQEGGGRILAKGEQRFFHAYGTYDIGISRDVTTEADWRSSNESVGGFEAAGVFTGRAAGIVEVWAESEGQRSSVQEFEVFETSALTYCDPSRINRTVWSDDFNRVTLESDCASYIQPEVVTLRYSVTEIQPHGGIFNPCLDLYVFAGQTKVRTIREQGCGDPFIALAAPGRDEEVLKYQLRAFWDLKDESGAPVVPGTYTIYGRFYLYYDPVVSIDVEVLAPGQATPTPAIETPGAGTPATPTPGESGPTMTPTPSVMCTPPLCASGEVFYCPGVCPGGCGTTCATPTTEPPSDGTLTPTPTPASLPPTA